MTAPAFTADEVQAIRAAASLHRYDGYEMARSDWPPRTAARWAGQYFTAADALDAIAAKIDAARATPTPPSA